MNDNEPTGGQEPRSGKDGPERARPRGMLIFLLLLLGALAFVMMMDSGMSGGDEMEYSRFRSILNQRVAWKHALEEWEKPPAERILQVFSAPAEDDSPTAVFLGMYQDAQGRARPFRHEVNAADSESFRKRLAEAGIPFQAAAKAPKSLLDAPRPADDDLVNRLVTQSVNHRTKIKEELGKPPRPDAMIITAVKRGQSEISGTVEKAGEKSPFFVSLGPRDGEELDALIAAAGDVQYKKVQPHWFKLYILPVLPWVLFFGIIWFFLLRQLRSGGPGGGVFSFGKSRARMYSEDHPTTTFDDVAGVDEAKDEVGEYIEFLKNPKKFRRLGARIPRGLLLVGAPGCGKTLLARAMAGEAGAPFFSISGSDFVEMFVGVGASRVRDLFKQAREKSPCIIFLDEIDAVGRRRGTGMGGGHDEREQTLNAILVEMDGFEANAAIIVVAATNRPDVLDPALLRPGRFDRSVTMSLPDVAGREKILKVHIKKVRTGDDVDLARVARSTPTFSGAELETLINEAALRAVMQGKSYVEQEDLEESRDKVRMGRERRSLVITEAERRVTAYHEAGHALINVLLGDEVDPLHKVTVVPRGMALGLTMSLPDKDVYNLRREQVFGQIKVLYGGRVAEQQALNTITTGAKNDIERATLLAKRMVCEWGMSDKIGPINYSSEEEHMFLGREIAKTKDHGESINTLIDGEIKHIIDECYTEVERLIDKHMPELEAIAQALLQYETLDAEEVNLLIAGEDIAPVMEEKLARRSEKEKQARRRRERRRAAEEAEDDLGHGPVPSPAPSG